MAISITKPVVNGSNNTWGDQINTALDTIVDAVNGSDADSPINLLDGATAETVVNGKAVIYGDAGEVVATSVTATSVTATSSIALDNAAGDWTFEVVSDKLVIKYGGVAKLEIDTSGNLTAVGDVQTAGTIA